MSTYIVPAVVAAIVAILGGLATDTGDWYRALKKPAWNPPDWLFGPAWMVIYGLCAWSAGSLWLAVETPGDRMITIALWGLNAVLNAAWSFLFFRARRMDWAFIEVIFLWLSTATLVAWSALHEPFPAWLLLVYLAWVSFAAFLNLTVLRLNRTTG